MLLLGLLGEEDNFAGSVVPPLSVAREVPLVLQTQQLPRPSDIAVLIRVWVTGRVHDVEINGLGCER